MRAFRYLTPVLKGRWWPSREQALADALAAGQAYVRAHEVRLFEFTKVEEQRPPSLPAAPVPASAGHKP
jgi:hypothetical protein